jgi:excisionase family DNA binding protein
MNYFTPKDLAERYRISERQVTHLARIGYLPGIKIGKLWRFREEDIEAWEGRHRGTDGIAKLADEIIRESC